MFNHITIPKALNMNNIKLVDKNALKEVFLHSIIFIDNIIHD